MQKPTEEALKRQRQAQINSLIGYIESLVYDRVTLAVEEVNATARRTQVNPKLKEEIGARIEESRSSIRTLLDLLLP